MPGFSRFFGLKACLILGDLHGLTTKVVPAGHRPEQLPRQRAAGTRSDSGRLWTISSHILRLWSDHETRPGKPGPEGPRVDASVVSVTESRFSLLGRDRVVGGREHGDTGLAAAVKVEPTLRCVRRGSRPLHALTEI